MLLVRYSNEDFAMFDSMIDHKDLIFQDATVRLVTILPADQTYENYLGAAFIRAMKRMHSIDCVTGAGAIQRPGFATVAAAAVLVIVARLSKLGV